MRSKHCIGQARVVFHSLCGPKNAHGPVAILHFSLERTRRAKVTLRCDSRRGGAAGVKVPFERKPKCRLAQPAMVTVFIVALACGATRAMAATLVDWKNNWQERT